MSKHFWRDNPVAPFNAPSLREGVNTYADFCAFLHGMPIYFYALIITSSILNFVNALRAWGWLAGRTMIRPASTV